MARRGHNEGTVRKRPDGRWEACVALDDGSRRSLYGKTRQEVTKKLAAAQRDIDQGIPVADERLTVEDYYTNWLETLGTLEESTVRRHREYVELHIVPELGRVKLSKLTARMVQEFYAGRLAAGLSTTTVNHLHGTVHKALDAAVRLGVLARNVSDLVDVPGMRRVEMHPLTAEETRRLLAAAKDERLQVFYVVAVSTGMRQGELLGLRWWDLDLEGRTVRVVTSLQWSRKRQEYIFKEPKTKRSRRQIALSEPAVEALRAHRARQLAERLKAGPAWQEGDLVFCSQTGGPLFGRYVYGVLLRLLGRAAGPLSRSAAHGGDAALGGACQSEGGLGDAGARLGRDHPRHLQSRAARHAAGRRGGDGGAARRLAVRRVVRRAVGRLETAGRSL